MDETTARATRKLAKLQFLKSWMLKVFWATFEEQNTTLTHHPLVVQLDLSLGVMFGSCFLSLLALLLVSTLSTAQEPHRSSSNLFCFIYFGKISGGSHLPHKTQVSTGKEKAHLTVTKAAQAPLFCSYLSP